MRTANERERMIAAKIMGGLEGATYKEALYALELVKGELIKRAAVTGAAKAGMREAVRPLEKEIARMAAEIMLEASGKRR